MLSRGNTDVLLEQLEHDEAAKEQKWFGLFTDLIFVTVIIQFALQITNHYVGFYLLPHELSRRYDSVHNGSCEKMEDNGETGMFLTDEGLQCDFVEKNVLKWLRESLLWLFAFYVVWLELGCVLGRFINIPGVMDDFFLFLHHFLYRGNGTSDKFKKASDA